MSEPTHLNPELPGELAKLHRTFPNGADLGTVRLLAPGEEIGGAMLSPLLLPIAEAGGDDAFALYVPPEAGSRASAVCAVNLATGVYAPISATVAGFGAYLLLLRRAQASLPAGPGFAARELIAQSEPEALQLAQVLGLGAVAESGVEPDPLEIAAALRRIEPSSPWACSMLAHAEARRESGLKALAPALAAAPFAAGLLEQAAELALERREEKRALRALFGALSRLEPNLQAAPFRIDEPDPETSEVFLPFEVADAFEFLRRHWVDATREMRDSTAVAFLERAAKDGALSVDAGQAIDFARRRGLGGDLPGGRWVLHFALAELREDAGARAALGDELARSWRLAGSVAFAARCERLAKEATSSPVRT